MIKIEVKNLDDIAKKHCDAVLPWVQGRIDKFLKKDYDSKEKWQTKFDDTDVDVFDWLKTNIRDIIIGDCKYLEGIRKEIDCSTNIVLHKIKNEKKMVKTL